MSNQINKDKYDLVNHLGLDDQEIEDIITNQSDYYLSYPIKKSDKKKLRWIDAPLGRLKELQYNILYNMIYKFAPHDAAVGFRTDQSVKTGAERHLGNKVILTMDISNFFNSIKYPQVVRLFAGLSIRITDPEKKLDFNKVEWNGEIPPGRNYFGVAALMCYKNQLPQGAPTSPAIANLYAMGLDAQLNKLAKQRGMVYTRYADDMTLSHPDKGYNIGQHVQDVIDVCQCYRLRVNHKKTRILRPHRRMLVTGVVINDKLAVPKYKWRNMRARLHNLVKENKSLSAHEYQKIRGYCEWIRHLNPKRGDQLLETLSKIPWKNS